MLASQFGRKGGTERNDWNVFISTMNLRSPIGALGLKVAPELDAVLLKQAENSQFQKNLHSENSITYCRVKHQVAWAEAEVQRLLTIGALSICHKPRLVHHWFVIVQKTKWRLIVDPWMLNECVVTPTAVSYEDLSVVKHLVKKGDVLWSFDLKNAYYQLWLEDWIRPFVCIKINGIYYQWNVCLLGFSWAPRVFTLVTQDLLIHKMRSQGLRISRYLDDFLGASSPEKFEEEVMIAAKIFLDSGAVVSIEKSVFTGVHVLRHLGLEINSLTMNLQIPLDKLIEFDRKVDFCSIGFKDSSEILLESDCRSSSSDRMFKLGRKSNVIDGFKDRSSVVAEEFTSQCDQANLCHTDSTVVHRRIDVGLGSASAEFGLTCLSGLDGRRSKINVAHDITGIVGHCQGGGIVARKLVSDGGDGQYGSKEIHQRAGRKKIGKHDSSIVLAVQPLCRKTHSSRELLLDSFRSELAPVELFNARCRSTMARYVHELELFDCWLKSKRCERSAANLAFYLSSLHTKHQRYALQILAGIKHCLTLLGDFNYTDPRLKMTAEGVVRYAPIVLKPQKSPIRWFSSGSSISCQERCLV